MRIEMKSAKVHDQVFLSGTNLGLTMGAGSVKGASVVMLYDTDIQCLIVTYKNETALVPFPTISCMVPKDFDSLFLGGVMPKPVKVKDKAATT